MADQMAREKVQRVLAELASATRPVAAGTAILAKALATMSAALEAQAAACVPASVDFIARLAFLARASALGPVHVRAAMGPGALPMHRSTAAGPLTGASSLPSGSPVASALDATPQVGRPWQRDPDPEEARPPGRRSQVPQQKHVIC